MKRLCYTTLLFPKNATIAAVKSDNSYVIYIYNYYYYFNFSFLDFIEVHNNYIVHLHIMISFEFRYIFEIKAIKITFNN